MGAIADSRCPSEDELAQLPSAVPGSVPAELARHLASCERCQQRVLFGEAARPARRRSARAVLPSPKHALVLLLAVIVAAAMLFYSLQRLAEVVR